MENELLRSDGIPAGLRNMLLYYIILHLHLKSILNVIIAEMNIY